MQTCRQVFCREVQSNEETVQTRHEVQVPGGGLVSLRMCYESFEKKFVGISQTYKRQIKVILCFKRNHFTLKFLRITMSLSLFEKKKNCKFFARCCIIMLYYFLATEASSEMG